MKKRFIQRILAVLLLVLATGLWAGATTTYNVSWNVGGYNVNIPVSSDEERSSDVYNAVSSHISSSGYGWIYLVSVESGESSEEWELCFSITNNTTGTSREASFTPWGFRIIQTAQTLTPTMSPPSGYLFRINPGGLVSFTVGNLSSDRTVSLIRTPIGGGASETVKTLTIHAPSETFSEQLEDGNYVLSTLGLIFTVRYSEEYYYKYSFSPSYSVYSIPADGGSLHLSLNFCLDEDGEEMVIESEDDIAFLQDIFDDLNGGYVPGWDPEGILLTAGYDDSEGACVDIVCGPNMGPSTRTWDTGLKRYGFSGSTVRFSQAGGGDIAKVQISNVSSHPRLNNTQYGVTYTLTDGERSLSLTGTGYPMAFSLSGYWPSWSIYASFSGKERFIGSYLSENDTVPQEGELEGEGANFIREYSYNDNGTASLVARYYDGLGYEKETVDAEGSGDETLDVIGLTRNDHLRRPWRQYQPFAIGQETPGSYYASPYPEQQCWWSGEGVAEEGYETAYRTLKYESAGSGRVLSEAFPGYGYHEEARRTRYDYRGNDSEEIKLLSMDNSGGLSWSGYYDAGTLSGVETLDGDGNRSLVWTDRDGRTVAEQSWFVDANEQEQEVETLYVYDDVGRLRLVVSPEGAALLSWGVTYAPSSVLVTQYCYSDTYDSRNRLTERRLPGAGVEYSVYDAGDRPVLFQDGNMRQDGKWKASYYDGIGRLIREDLRPGGNYSRAQIQAGFDGAGTHTVYTDSTAATLLRQYIYDEYPQDLDSRLSYRQDTLTGTGAADRRKISGKGLLVAEKLNLLGTSQYAFRVHYYDAEDNEIQTVMLYPDGTLLRTSVLYDRQGRMLGMREERTRGSSGSSAVLNTDYELDSHGRLTRHSSSLSVAENGRSASARCSALYSFDEINRPSSIRTGAVTTYLYHAQQGWENRRVAYAGAIPVFQSSLIFERDLDEEDPQSQFHNAPSWTGNVSAWQWSHRNGTPLTGVYAYDGLSRLIESRQYSGYTISNLYRENLSYDRNGNITWLHRNNGSSYGETFNRSYLGNHCTAWSYDSNGNLTSMQPGDQEEFPLVGYNILNLPKTIDGIDDDHSVIRYLADGTKVSAMAYEDGYLYAGPFRFYTDGLGEVFESAATAEGRTVNPDFFSGSLALSPRYFIKDHLGSTRAVVDTLGTVLEEADFLPYGEKCDNPLLLSGENSYLYGGKELHETFFNIPWYDSGKRFQTTEGVFASMDPLYWKHYSVTPYSYCNGNPLRYIDPEGADFWDKVLGYTIGLATNFIPFSGNLRDVYAPTDPTDYNNALKMADSVSEVAGSAMVVGGAAAVAARSATAEAGLIVSATGIGSTAGLVTVAAGGVIDVTGTLSVTAGTAVVLSARNNSSKGYERGKVSGKNERHGDNGRSLSKSQERIRELKLELQNSKSRKERQRIKKTIDNIKQDAGRKERGEEHSRMHKR